MNPGGVRNDLLPRPSAAASTRQVTYGEAFSVQPFGNSLVTLTLTGAQIDARAGAAVRQPVGRLVSASLQVSQGFTYAWDRRRRRQPRRPGAASC